LTVAVAPALPHALAVLQVDTCEDAAVEAEGMAVVNDEVVEVGLQPGRRPALFGGPAAGSAGDRDAAHAGSPGAAQGAHQDVAIRGHGRLHDAGVRRPRVLPEQPAVGRHDADRAASASLMATAPLAAADSAARSYCYRGPHQRPITHSHHEWSIAPSCHPQPGPWRQMPPGCPCSSRRRASPRWGWCNEPKRSGCACRSRRKNRE